uniref:C2 domain-containing protein n=1 Tax=Nelumbo nucifera TaxID=4432 RepID=A0A822YQJ5_NELNU|nr:TPA_asm: hypothetical protein HUJ06_007095 [Nelumbo nucifera]
MASSATDRHHKQDVYAKLCLTSNPKTTLSTRIINGRGRNPVFNENLRLNVRTIESSLKCEIWMLSRVPLSDILIGNRKLAQEFSLSSTDLFHSPARFVQLYISYSGASSEIEFPYPKIVNENNLMVLEYFGIPCSTLDSQSFERLGRLFLLASRLMTNQFQIKLFVAGGISLPSTVRVRLFMGRRLCFREAKKKKDLPAHCHRSSKETFTTSDAFCLRWLERIAE